MHQALIRAEAAEARAAAIEIFTADRETLLSGQNTSMSDKDQNNPPVEVSTGEMNRLNETYLGAKAFLEKNTSALGAKIFPSKAKNTEVESEQRNTIPEWQVCWNHKRK